jgi:hypothetical protein
LKVGTNVLPSVAKKKVAMAAMSVAKKKVTTPWSARTLAWMAGWR